MNTVGTRTIETDRLVLRKFKIEDADDMYGNWTSDDEVTKFMPWPTHESAGFTRQLLTEWVSYYDDGGTYNWGITLKGDDHVIGNIAVVSKNENIRSFEIGYCLGKKHWGKGIMPEALRAVIAYLFDGVVGFRGDRREGVRIIAVRFGLDENGRHLDAHNIFDFVVGFESYRRHRKSLIQFRFGRNGARKRELLERVFKLCFHFVAQPFILF